MRAEVRWRTRDCGGALSAFLCLALHLLVTRAQCQAQPANIQAVLNSNSNLTFMATAISAAGLSRALGTSGANLTLFAPSDTAFRSALAFGSISCTTDFYSTSACTSAAQLLASTDLRDNLLNFIANGALESSSFTNATRVQLLGSKIQQTSVLRNNQTWFGNSPLVQKDITTGNGIVHILGTWPTTDMSLNESSIFIAAKLGGFGPFNVTKRTAIVSSDGSNLPTSVPSLVSSYQRIRKAVDLPQGGLANPMSITYNPESMYRLLRAAPEGGYADSESAPGSMGSGGVAASPDATLSAQEIQISANPAVPSSLPTSASAVAFAPLVAVSSVQGPTSINSSRAQASTVEIPSMGESGVLGEGCLGSNMSAWNYPESPRGLRRPRDNDTLAFFTVLELGSLIKSRQVTSVELVEIFTGRLKRYDYVLEAVVTYTTELGLQQARAADELLRSGTYLGPLHGIPYGLKDIIAVKGYPTTWGAPQFRNQFINENANVYNRLSAAGAVLIAKLATGEMAYDDVWWGGKTKNPWNIAQGSSGSSAGPAASVVAATVPFSVGTETEGSLMSPAQTCGATAMRPSLGSIGRSWVMTLADSLGIAITSMKGSIVSSLTIDELKRDKIGPVCRSVADCAIIFDILRGQDDLDPTSRHANLLDPFEVDVSQLTVGYIPGMEESAPEVLEVLQERGVTLKPFGYEYAVNAEDAIMNIMISEAAAHFDYWQRSGQDDMNRRQDYWPPLLRLARLIPAVEYIQAQRARSTLAVQVLGSMRAAGIDAFIGNTTTELAMCNLVGIPTVSVPIGFSNVSNGMTNSTRKQPITVGFFGWPNGEPELLSLGMAWQNETSYHLEQPPIDDVEPEILNQCQPFSRCTLPKGSLAPALAPSINITTEATGAAPVADSG